MGKDKKPGVTFVLRLLRDAAERAKQAKDSFTLECPFEIQHFLVRKETIFQKQCSLKVCPILTSSIYAPFATSRLWALAGDGGWYGSLKTVLIYNSILRAVYRLCGNPKSPENSELWAHAPQSLSITGLLPMPGPLRGRHRTEVLMLALHCSYSRPLQLLI